MKKLLNDSLIGKIFKTFFEGFLASLIVSLPTITDIFDKSLLRTVLVGAIAMGISMVLNLLQSLLKKDEVIKEIMKEYKEDSRYNFFYEVIINNCNSKMINDMPNEVKKLILKK
ncbi:MAG: hypothetical protein IJ094_02500 [Bacilli bacterium]|nr:hypothetical protein [Bacilli bacterium]